MSTFLAWINQVVASYERPRSAANFALFRILFFTHVLVMVYYTHVYKGLIFDSVPGFGRNPFPFNAFLVIWFISASCCLIGWQTRFAALVNYCCVVLVAQLYFRSGISSYYDDLMRMGSLLCLFLPVSRIASIDSIIFKTTSGQIGKQNTSQFAYTFAIISTIGLLYLGSGLTKTYAPIWQSGLGLWLPMSMPYLKWNMLPNTLADAIWLLKPTNYLVMAWEILFLPLVFFKETRKIAIVLGLIFHLSIGLFFFLPKTAIGTLVFYVFFIPDSFWVKVKLALESKRKLSIWIPDQPISIRCWQLLRSIDIRNKWIPADSPTMAFIHLDNPNAAINLLKQYVVGYPIGLFLQSGAAAGILNLLKWFGLNLPIQKLAKPIPYSSYKVQIGIVVLLFLSSIQLIVNANHCYSHLRGIEQPSAYRNEDSKPANSFIRPSALVRWLFGIDSRGVFLDKALVAKRKTVAIIYTHLPTGSTGWLPLVQPNGYVQSDLNLNGEWTKPQLFYILKQNKIQPSGIERTILFWAYKKKQTAYEYKFTVLERFYDYPTHFELGYATKMEQIPWDTAAVAGWDKEKFYFTPTQSR